AQHLPPTDRESRSRAAMKPVHDGPSAGLARTRVILDCDPGHDDALAIVLAGRNGAIDLRAITTVAGNQTLAKTTLNARRMCTVAGVTGMPIAAGSARPLGQEPLIAEGIHGETGLDG